MKPDDPTAKERLEDLLRAVALGTVDELEIDDPNEVARAISRLAVAAAGLAFALSDGASHWGSQLDVDERDRWDTRGAVLLALGDDADGTANETQQEVVARATEHVPTTGELVREYFPGTPLAERYRRERERGR